MANFRAIGQSVWEKNGNTQTETQTDRNTDTLEFYKDRYNRLSNINDIISLNE